MTRARSRPSSLPQPSSRPAAAATTRARATPPSAASRAASWRPACPRSPSPRARPLSTAGITVVGTGSVKVAPDVAQWSFGVHVSADTAAAALADASEGDRAGRGRAREAGVARDDLQTEQASSIHGPVRTGLGDGLRRLQHRAGHHPRPRPGGADRRRGGRRQGEPGLWADAFLPCPTPEPVRGRGRRCVRRRAGGGRGHR